MGKSCECCITNSSFFEASDWINIAGILVNAALAVYIIIKIQEKYNNKRALKDHLISEVIRIRDTYRIFFDKLYNDELEAKVILPWFKLMNIQMGEIMKISHDKYAINRDMMLPLQFDFLNIVANNRDFMVQFRSLTPVRFSSASKVQFIIFMQQNSHLFNELIIKVNDAK